MKILNGDSLEVLKSVEDNSFDALVTDPPYGLSKVTPQMMADCLAAWSIGETWNPKKKKGFMNKEWDSFVPQPDLWREVYRVMKPGAYGVIFAGTRTQDLMSVSLRLAGFEVRDTLMWIYGSGFPKSHNVALGIDKLNGHPNRGKAIPTASRYQASDTEEKNKLTSNPVEAYEAKSTESKDWQGWGTALKPAYEPIILVRKPPEGTVAQNILAHGVGGINIDATRIPLQEGENTGVTPQTNKVTEAQRGFRNKSAKIGSMNEDWKKGRWPANIMLAHHEDCTYKGQKEIKVRGGGSIKGGNGYSDGGYDHGQKDLRPAFDGYSKSGKELVEHWGCVEGCPVQELDRQSGVQKSGVAGSKSRAWGVAGEGSLSGWKANGSEGYGDTGGASRFFYTTKANKKEREAGLEPREDTKRANVHPTVKPIDLMRYLVRMVTPPGGKVLEPFLGSGTTLCACALEYVEGFGIEREEEYADIAKERIRHWSEIAEAERVEVEEVREVLPLFEGFDI